MESQPNPQEMVQVNFKLQIREREFAASAEVPAGPTTPQQLLPVLQDLCSGVVDVAVRGVEAMGKTISCQAGCGACCRQLVPISLFEAETLGDWIRGLDPETVSILEARFDSAVAKLKQQGILDRIDPNRPFDGESTEQHSLAMDYLAVGVPCPFLQDESCGIHPFRPLICREYLVTSPARYCAAPTPETVDTVGIPLKMSQAMFDFASVYTDNGHGWIPLTFLFMWIRSGVRLPENFTEPGPELLRRVMNQVISRSGPDRKKEVPAEAEGLGNA